MDTKQLSATDRAYHHLKSGILGRAYDGGTLLTEGEIAAAVGVSRTPVREALLRLEVEGLLRLYPKRGALVLPVSPQEVEDVLETRELVESATAVKALRRADRVVPVLTDLLDRQRRQAAAGDAVAFMDADRAFHQALVAAAGNAILDQLYESLRDRQLRMGLAVMAAEPERMQRSIVEHAAILEAVETGDEERVQAAVRRHLTNLVALLRTSR